MILRIGQAIISWRFILICRVECFSMKFRLACPAAARTLANRRWPSSAWLMTRWRPWIIAPAAIWSVSPNVVSADNTDVGCGSDVVRSGRTDEWHLVLSQVVEMTPGDGGRRVQVTIFFLRRCSRPPQRNLLSACGGRFPRRRKTHLAIIKQMEAARAGNK